MLDRLHVFRATTIKYAGRCPSGFAEGALSVTGHSSNASDRTTYTVASTFVHGRPTGRTSIQSLDGFSYIGTTDLSGNMTATVTYPDGSVEQSEFRGNVLWRGTSTNPARDPAILYYLKSREVPASMYQADLAGRGPPDAVFDPNLAPRCPTISLSRGKPATQRASCNGTGLSGVYAVPFVSTDSKQATLTSTFVDGRPSGFGRIGYVDQGTFFGTLTGFSRGEGVTVSATRGTERGTYKNDRLYDGSFVPQGSTLATIVLRYRHGKLVGPSEAAQRALLARVPPGEPMPRMAKLNIEGSTCYASLPTNEYKVSQAEMPGRCPDGYYTGRAKFTLAPLRAGLSTETVTIAFDHGLPTGEARVSLPNNQTFVGTLRDWRPASGQMSQALGGDNYEVLAFSDGVVVSRRQEHRQPSEGEIAGRQILGALLGGLTRCMQGGCGGQATSSSASQNYPQSSQSSSQPTYRQPQAERNQPQILCSVYAADGRYVPSSDPTECAASSRAGAGRQSSAPSPPPSQDAAATPPSICSYYTGDGRYISSTNPAECAAGATASTGPARRQTSEPVRDRQVASIPVPAASDGELQASESRENAICSYYSPSGQYQSSTDPAVCAAAHEAPAGRNMEPASQPASSDQSARNGITQSAICSYYTADGQYQSSTDPAVCAAAAQEAQNTPRLAATPPVPTQSNSPSITTPASSTSNTSSSLASGAKPGTPSGTSPGSFSQAGAPNLGNSVRMSWSAPYGASYYEFGITDVSTGQLVVDTQVSGTSYNVNLPSGQYRWNVAACNAARDCSAYTSRLYFSVGGTSASVGSPTSSTSASKPTPPTGLYPTNEGELAVPMTLGWNWPTGAEYFRVAIHDRTTETFPVDDELVTTNSYRTPTLTAGHQFRWDVMACNSAGCSGRSENRNFRTANGTAFVWDCAHIVGQGALGRSYTAEEKAFFDQCITPNAEAQCALAAHLPYNSGMLPRETIAKFLASNAKEAARYRSDIIWYFAMVGPGGPWDYKKYGYPAYEPFGNYHYGYTGTAAGFPRELLLRAAGAVQIAVDFSRRNTSGSGNPLGDAPYGDQYTDQLQIINGINDYLLCHGKQ